MGRRIKIQTEFTTFTSDTKQAGCADSNYQTEQHEKQTEKEDLTERVCRMNMARMAQKARKRERERERERAVSYTHLTLPTS